MSHGVLLIDDSLTVQKVVALTLDRNVYQVTFAKTRAEAVKQILEETPKLILVSDQVKDLNVGTFPKEVESWLGRQEGLPAIFLISGRDIKEMRHYAGVIRKPFAPDALRAIVSEYVKPKLLKDNEAAMGEDFHETKLEKAFNSQFNDEAKLVEETLREVNDEPTLLNLNPPLRQEKSSNLSTDRLWKSDTGTSQAKEQFAILGSEDSMAYKTVLENKVRQEISSSDLETTVGRVLQDILPPIVERLVQERLDALLAQEGR